MPISAAALAGLGWVASPIVKDLVHKSISYLGTDIAKGLEDLETILLPQFQLTLQAVQRRPDGDIAPLAKWLARLKNAYFDAEAILHELEYGRLKRKAKGEDKKIWVRLSSKPIIKPLAKFTGQVVKKAHLFSPQKRKLLERLNKLKEVAAEVRDFRDLLKEVAPEARNLRDLLGTDGVRVDNHHSHTSALIADKVFGRDGDRDDIIKFLLVDGDRDGGRYSVVAITGMEGVGKTTLAQYIYNDPRVKDHFPIRMWLCISRNLDIIKRTKEMIECVSKEECPNISNLNILQEKLLEILPESDNIIVVLDDIWYDREPRENQWDELLKPFAIRGAKCKIVVTSRSSQSFPNALQPGKFTNLSDLAIDHFKPLLRYHAIDGLKFSDAQLEKDLGDIVDQIAKKMSKSPLAAKVVGNQLRKRPEIPLWRDTLENVNLSEIMEILSWSFHHFDVQLQRCFLFRSIFSKGTRSNHLESYWMALDFIQPFGNNSNVQKIGLEYLQIMVANSIFRQEGQRYIMHDLFHDLAEKLSVGDCFRVTDDDEREIPSTVQHVYLRVKNEILKEKLSRICNLSNLHTLIVGNPFIDDISEIITDISINFRNLRVLEVISRGYKTVPRVIGDLKNLRLLSFWKSSIEELPDSILQLYHLQFLELPSTIKTLPTKLSNLIKLQSIIIINSDGSETNSLPPVPYLGKLTSLQRLDEFHVRKDEGYKLHQLGHLNHIGGFLRIVNLENVSDLDEAVEARLIDKSKIKRFELVWAKSAETNASEIEVIEALQPPTNLEWLTIDGYMGSTYPTWLQGGSFIKNTKGVSFYNCNALTILPPNFHQFRYCSEIVLKNLGALRELSTFPECLARLSIIKCPCLILVCENERQVNVSSSLDISRFFHIGGEKYKHILDHELKSFKQMIPVENNEWNLQILESAARDNATESSLNFNIDFAWLSCHLQRMNFIFGRNTPNKLKLPSRLRFLDLCYCCVSDGALSDFLRGMTTLEKLYLEGIMTITTLPPAQVLESLQSLRDLKIKDCWYLRSLGGMHALPHLQSFWIEGCWHVEMDKRKMIVICRNEQVATEVKALLRITQNDNNIRFCTNSQLNMQNDVNRQYVTSYLVTENIQNASSSSFGRGNTQLPPTLKSFIIMNSRVPLTILNGNFPCLEYITINNCPVPRSLSFHQLTNLTSLSILHCPTLISIEGLESRPFINNLCLVALPNFDVESVWGSWQGCRQKLTISSSVMLNNLLSFHDFAPPQFLVILYCQEEAISFEKSDHLLSIKKLTFQNCKTKNFPKTLGVFSTLEFIEFINCSEISELPELPDSVQSITIRGCPVLRERCQPNNGPDWHKFERIQNRWIE